MKITAVVTAAAFLFTVVGAANADDRYGRHERSSTTKKVIKSLAVGAIAGLAYYALTRDDHRVNSRVSIGYQSRGGRSYVAFGADFNSYAVGSPFTHRSWRSERGYWHRDRHFRFYRIPYRYNSRYDRAFNAGWERGYWAGYLQGLNDSRNRFAYDSRFYWPHRSYWGYSPAFGSHRSYQRAFVEAFRIGYEHAWRGYSYGHDGFGFGISFGYRR